MMPTKAGWYWWRRGKEARSPYEKGWIPVEVLARSEGGLEACFPMEYTGPGYPRESSWCDQGSIEPPGEGWNGEWGDHLPAPDEAKQSKPNRQTWPL